MNKVPSNAIILMAKVYRHIFPAVDTELHYWRKRAQEIPDAELRSQALASMDTKKFHCQGGGVYALLAGVSWKKAIRFIVAYQTISDYLDNLCDRSTSMDPDDFRLLHESMKDALRLSSTEKNYYRLRENQDDGGYLRELVSTCQGILKDIPTYHLVENQVYRLESLYTNLQVHKHVTVEERVPRLTNWYKQNKIPHLIWYEFAAASGSTLGIFCSISYVLGGRMTDELAENIYDSYFPFMQGLHILLDYLIDQEEDRKEGDLNFCFYYPNQEIMKERFLYFMEEADQSIQNLPDHHFHRMIHQGLVGLYLAESKIKQLQHGHEIRKKLLKKSGTNARFFYWNSRIYNRIQRK